LELSVQPSLALNLISEPISNTLLDEWRIGVVLAQTSLASVALRRSTSV
jgi:hypothetical protein